MMHFICLTIRAAASCSSEHQTLVNQPLKALLSNLGSGLLLPIRLCWACKVLDINGNWAGGTQKLLTISEGLSELIKGEDKWMAACDTLGEVRGWDKGRRAKGNVCATVSEAHIATGMQKG